MNRFSALRLQPNIDDTSQRNLLCREKLLTFYLSEKRRHRRPANGCAPDRTFRACKYLCANAAATPRPKKSDLPKGGGWPVELINLSTHNSTHFDASCRFLRTMLKKAAGKQTRGIPLTGTQVWCRSGRFVHTAQRYGATKAASVIWKGHQAGRDVGDPHLEKLHNLEVFAANRLLYFLFFTQDPQRIGQLDTRLRALTTV